MTQQINLDQVSVPAGEGRANVFAKVLSEALGFEISKVIIDEGHTDGFQAKTEVALSRSNLSTLLGVLVVFNGKKMWFTQTEALGFNHVAYNYLIFSC